MRLPITLCIYALISFAPLTSVSAADTLPGTKPLTMQGDIAAQLVAGVDKFLLQELDKSVDRRAKHWKRDFSSTEAYSKSIEPNRKRLAHILGLRDPRVPFDAPELIATTTQSALVGKGKGYNIFAVRWPAFRNVYGEGLLLVPTGKTVANVIAVADADQTPEQIVGLVEGIAPESQFARRLAENGCRVLVPMLVSRTQGQFTWGGGRRHGMTNREFLYRTAFELGRHLVGYEVQKILAGVDWMAKENGANAKIGVIGYGEGGMLALYAGALDTRIDAVCVSGHFEARRSIWQQPLDRNVFGLLSQFGDAELAAMVAPRKLIVEAARGPEKTIRGGGGGPAVLATPKLDAVKAEITRADKLTGGFAKPTKVSLHVSGDGNGPFGADPTLRSFLSAISSGAKLADAGKPPTHLRKTFDPNVRLERQMRQIDRHTQWVLRESPWVRKQFMSKLDHSSPAAYEKSAEQYRDIFYDEVIGRFDNKILPPDARTRKSYDGGTWVGYEVVLDVYPGVIAYGILCLPKDLKKGEKRPVVVCQHGLEGRPQSVIGKKDYHYYKAFAAKLASRGFITFAPQNLYIGQDKFRTLQRKANPLGKTLFSIIVPQHQQIVDWLKTQPNVDPKRIAFYGLSYGGKTAMRVPPLVTDYCLSICSADFNEWVDKNASTRNPRSYVWSGEYEIFEWDLGSTFNYAEMAALIAPRPFMVERGHFDGVGDDWTVGWEFAKVRNLYAAKLKLPERCEIEWFYGPHTINEKGTYDFLHKHLNWPKR